jgi:hypothetical protein
MVQILDLSSLLWKQTLSVATGFWALCLALVAVEATWGASIVTGTLFFLSVPALVGFLIWANKALLILMRRGFAAAFAIAAYVLLCATLIVFVGLFAAANLKNIIVAV